MVESMALTVSAFYIVPRVT